MSTTDAPTEGEPLVRDIMTTPVITVPPSMTVKDLAALFRDKRIGGVPVVDEDRLVGIVTEGDLMAMDADVQMPHWFELFDSIIYLGSQKKFKEQLEKASAATVEQLMTDEVQTVAPDDEARVAATLMHKHRFDRVPVVERRSGGGHRHAARHHEDPGALSARRTTPRRRRGRPRGDPPQRPPAHARPPGRRGPLRGGQGQRLRPRRGARGARRARGRVDLARRGDGARGRRAAGGRPHRADPDLRPAHRHRARAGRDVPAPRSWAGRRRSSPRPPASVSASTSSSTPAWVAWACRPMRSATSASRPTSAASSPGLMSHFATADEADTNFFEQQLARFTEAGRGAQGAVPGPALPHGQQRGDPARAAAPTSTWCAPASRCTGWRRPTTTRSRTGCGRR